MNELISKIKKINIRLNIALTILVMTCILGCAQTQNTNQTNEISSEENVRVYDNEAQFEEALINGEEVVGSKVTFTAGLMNPASPYGYIIYSGKKLNFCSKDNPHINPGDKLTVTVTSAKLVEGSFIIEY